MTCSRKLLDALPTRLPVMSVLGTEVLQFEAINELE